MSRRGFKRTALGVMTAALAVSAFMAVRSRSAAREFDELESQVPSIRSAQFTLECSAQGAPISPSIYGFGGEELPWQMSPGARRWGGNPTTRYNWETNNSNLAKDWFFKNAPGGPGGYRRFLDENRQRGVKTALTLPMIGWVAKDGTSYAFPVAAFGPQQEVAPDNKDMGNGVGVDGKPLPPGAPTLTSVASTPESIGRWVQQIRTDDGDKGRSVDAYILDNEPTLWNSTHRDVHPEPLTYDELLEKTIAYATVVRKADPEGKIAGPAEWGWLGYQYSAKDIVAGVFLRPDRRAHGDEPLLPWYLRKLREHEQKTGMKLLDIVDVHFYPMGEGIGITTGGKTDPATAARRIRSTRSLWDPIYKDESWVDAPMQVIPRLREWIGANYPGLGISIGEWNFGAENHMSGGLAVAEVLGRFGVEGLTSAYYWTVPADRSPAFWAFRAYRNFDGSGGRFLDRTVPVTGSATLTSLFASRDEDRKKVVAVLLNLSALTTLNPAITVQGCGAISAARGLTYTGGTDGFKPLDVSAADQSLKLTAPPYSITVLELNTAPPK
jgi:hypothetical protein